MNAPGLSSDPHGPMADICTLPTSTMLFQPEGAFWQAPPGYWNMVHLITPQHASSIYQCLPMFTNNDIDSSYNTINTREPFTSQCYLIHTRGCEETLQMAMQPGFPPEEGFIGQYEGPSEEGGGEERRRDEEGG